LWATRQGDLVKERMNVVGSNLVAPLLVLDEQPDGTKIMERLLGGADPKTQTIAPVRNRHAALGQCDQRTKKLDVTKAPEQRRLDLALPTCCRVSPGQGRLQVLAFGQIV